METNTKIIYEVFVEDLWDYYAVPRIITKVGTADDYNEAVKIAKKWVRDNIGTLINDPACCYITPTPEGKEFDSWAYLKTLEQSK